MARGLVLTLILCTYLINCVFADWPIIAKCRVKAPTSQDEPNARSPRPVLLIPGVGGSMLFARTAGFSPAKAWLSFLEADDKCLEYLLSRFDPQTNRTNSVNGWEIFPPRDAAGLCAVDNLDPDLIAPAVKHANYYSVFIQTLQQYGYVPLKSIWGFPYDWRQSIRDPKVIDMLRSTVQNLASYSSTGKIDIISHSMGGLMTKIYLGAYPEDIKYIGKWVAIATPWQGGAAKAIQSFINGYNLDAGFLGLGLSDNVAHQISQQMPSVYELLPNPTLPMPFVNFRLGSKSYKVTGFDLRDFFQKVNEGFKPQWNPDIWDYSIETRVKLAVADGVIKKAMEANLDFKFFSVYGNSTATGFDLFYQTPVNSVTELTTQKVKHNYVDGDGTVTVKSATADPNSIQYVYTGSGKHKTMLSDSGLVQGVINLLIGNSLAQSGSVDSVLHKR